MVQDVLHFNWLVIPAVHVFVDLYMFLFSLSFDLSLGYY